MLQFPAVASIQKSPFGYGDCGHFALIHGSPLPFHNCDHRLRSLSIRAQAEPRAGRQLFAGRRADTGLNFSLFRFFQLA
jgi:hypothetical protein